MRHSRNTPSMVPVRLLAALVISLFAPSSVQAQCKALSFASALPLMRLEQAPPRPSHCCPSALGFRGAVRRLRQKPSRHASLALSLQHSYFIVSKTVHIMLLSSSSESLVVQLSGTQLNKCVFTQGICQYTSGSTTSVQLTCTPLDFSSVNPMQINIYNGASTIATLNLANGLINCLIS